MKSLNLRRHLKSAGLCELASDTLGETLPDLIKSMKYFGKTKANAYALFAAIVATVGIRHFLLSADTNLLIVSAIFILVYTAIFLIAALLRRRFV